jgi:NadR type nicotinamide-nucleotide adenylyltransferase
MSKKILKIAITGTESTGKSTLSKALATHYATVFVPEYARAYLEKLPRKYNYDDILEIAKAQKEEENKLLPLANGLLIADTELLVTKIWCEQVYGKCHTWIIDQLANQHYDLYLLTDIDLPWEYDPLREHPHLREHLFDCYLKEIMNRKWNFRLISGNYEQRTKNAIQAIDELCLTVTI